VAKVYAGGDEKRQVSGKTVYGGKAAEFELYFPDNRHILVGPPGAFEGYLGRPVAKDGPLAGAIKLAASGKPVGAAADIAGLPIPKELLNEIPAEARPLLKAQQVLLSLDLGADARIDLKATYADAAAAADAEKAVRVLADMGRKELAKLRARMEDQ